MYVNFSRFKNLFQAVNSFHRFSLTTIVDRFVRIADMDANCVGEIYTLLTPKCLFCRQTVHFGEYYRIQHFH